LIGSAASDADLEAMFEQHHRPLVVTNDRSVFVCSCADEVQEREVSGDVQQRQVSGDVQQRQVSGDVQQRQVSGDVQQHQISGDVQQRQVSGDEQQRQVSGGVQQRQVSGDVQQRQVSGDVQAAATPTLSCVATPSGCGGFRVEGASSYVVYEGSNAPECHSP